MRTLYLRNAPDDVVERLERMAARDSTLAEQLDYPIVTSDGRPGNAVGIRCPVTVVPR